MCEPDSIDAVGRFELAVCDQRAFVVAGNHRPVYGALDLTVADRKGNLLSHWLAGPGSFVDSSVDLAAPAVHLKGRRPKSPDDEVSASGCRTIQVCLPRRSHVVSGNEHAVGMRVSVEV